MLAFLYPGQGSQKVGMGKDLVEEYEIARKIYNEADKTLGFSISNISFEGGDEMLTRTENAQPAILIYSHIATEILISEKGYKPDYVAGHSLGEFSSLLTSGMLSFEDALRIVRRRGELMSSADPEGKGGMAAVLGLDDDIVKEVCEEISKDDYVEAVNFNCPGQVVISGLKTAIDKAEARLKEAGAKRVLKLNVSGAFHSKLMEEKALEFGEYLKQFKFAKPKIKLVSNVTAKLEDEKNIIENLINQMRRPVLWTDSIKFLANEGMNKAIEVGFGNVVSGLVKKIDGSVDVDSWNKAL